MAIRTLACALLVVAMVVAGCGDDDGADVAEQLHGTWYAEWERAYHTWEPDGSWYVVAGTVEGDPYDTGTYTVDGSIVTVDTDDDARTCPQTTGRYEVTFVDSDTMVVELIEDECLSREVNAPGSWVRVEDD